jgi:L,D-transpeptidase YcfS
MFRFLISLIFLKSLIFGLEAQTYSISVCTTSTLENAINCKKDASKNESSNFFIVKNKDGKYRTYLGSFSTYSQAKDLINKSSEFVKKQQPFIEKLPYDLKARNLNGSKDSKYIDMNELNDTSKKEKKPTKQTTQISNEIKYLEELKNISTQLIDKYTPEITSVRKVDNLLSEFSYFDNLIIEVDSSNNSMVVSGESERGLKNLKTYKVSTAKKSIKKPLGLGHVTSIALNPVWYPTDDTIESFKKRGINLPAVVPGGDKLNYMGSAKINLTHRVDGKDTFRIHGTISEKTIGSYESSGCIRMKNSDVIQLVGLLNEFIDFKSMNDIKVILK